MNRRLAIFGFVVSASVVASEGLAQPGGPRGDRPNPFGVGALLYSDQVREEIGLLGEQEEELRAMGDEMRDRMRSLFSGMRDLPPEERRAAFEDARAEMEVIRGEVEGRVQEVLMPDQFDRLRQIELQQQMRRRGNAALTSNRVAEALGLSDEQQAQMQEKAQSAQQELEKKIQQLREEAREEVLSVLTPEQRAKFDELVGTPFEMQQGRGFGGRSGGDRRGGDRQGGPRGGRRGGPSRGE